jgi:hypothetical protein
MQLHTAVSTFELPIPLFLQNTNGTDFCFFLRGNVYCVVLQVLLVGSYHWCGLICHCHNFEPQQVRITKLFRMVRCRGGRIASLFTYLMCLVPFPWSSQRLPSAGGNFTFLFPKIHRCCFLICSDSTMANLSSYVNCQIDLKV